MGISRLEIFAPPKIRNKKSTFYSLILTLHSTNKNNKRSKTKRILLISVLRAMIKNLF